jgi:hypothetical protein
LLDFDAGGAVESGALSNQLLDEAVQGVGLDGIKRSNPWEPGLPVAQLPQRLGAVVDQEACRHGLPAHKLGNLLVLCGIEGALISPLQEED